ncbi:unnamed protein product [Symbiodinium natans]|uniref:Uncharacterized protein n=1 Tax=Symbiodinium natans TaxID=878477 RepID=A0A812GQD6_9DINO|nr:unnamed protein product [Symbiodinium natans]
MASFWDEAQHSGDFEGLLAEQRLLEERVEHGVSRVTFAEFSVLLEDTLASLEKRFDRWVGPERMTQSALAFEKNIWAHQEGCPPHRRSRGLGAIMCYWMR